jgi:spermidine synthase
VVHEFASKYFQLPTDYEAVIDDAVVYTRTLAEQGEKKYDYIVHDVFTGGAEPLSLFTLEFLEGLNALLKPDGVIAIVSYTRALSGRSSPWSSRLQEWQP